MRGAYSPCGEPKFYFPASGWRFAALHVMIVRPHRKVDRGRGESKQTRRKSMKHSLVNILAETGKVSCFAALLLCVSSAYAGEPKYKADGSTFQCITKMTSVKHYFVGNLADNLKGTVAVAQAGRGEFPEGSVLQLIPNEVMVKQQKGFSPKTNDWEFFALDTDKDGTKIVSHGAEEVNNFLGLNCFGCHQAARAEFDLVCEQDHGCAPLPVTRAMFHAIQHTDPRCPPEQLSAEDAAALKELGPIIEQIKNETAANKK
jgi:hypothetical protein